MEHQKLTKWLDNTSVQPSKFRKKNWVEIKTDSPRTYNTSSQIKFKTSMLNLSLSDYNDAYFILNRTIIITWAGRDEAAKQLSKRNKVEIFKNCASFTYCISQINNTQVDNAKDLDVVMPMHILMKYSNNYSRTSGSLWQCYRDQPENILTKSKSFKFKITITKKSSDAGNTTDV